MKPFHWIKLHHARSLIKRKISWWRQTCEKVKKKYQSMCYYLKISVTCDFTYLTKIVKILYKYVLVYGGKMWTESMCYRENLQPVLWGL